MNDSVYPYCSFPAGSVDSGVLLSVSFHVR